MKSIRDWLKMRTIGTVPIAFLIMVLFSVPAFAADAWVLDFESADAYVPGITEFSDGGNDYWGTIFDDAGDLDVYSSSHGYINETSGLAFNGILGSYFFGGMDTDGDQPVIPSSITVSNIDISGYTDLVFYSYIATDNPASLNWDSTDYVHFQYSVDGGAWTDLIWVESSSTLSNQSPKIDTDFDGLGDGTAITDTFVEFSKAIAETGSSIDIKVEFFLNDGDTDIAIDNLRIAGTAGGGDTTPPAAISNLTAIAGSDDGEIDLVWTAPGDDGTSGDMPAGSSLIIYAATYTLTDTAALSAVSQTPYTMYKIVQSTDYTTEWTEHSYTMTGLYPGTTYYFAVTLTDDSSNTSVWNYSGAVNTKSTAPACDLAPDIVSAVSASPSDGAISVSWTEPAALDIDHYIVEVSSFGTYPVGDFSSIIFSSNVSAGYSAYPSTATLENHNTYYYRITTYDWDVDTPNGLYSLELSSAYAYTNAFPYKTPPATPGSWAGAGQSSTTIKWSWADVADESGYRIKCATDTFTILKELAADVQEWTETNLTINTSYYRVIASSNSAGESALSSAATSWTLANPSTGTYCSDVFQSSVTISWFANNNPSWTNYGLSYSTYSDFSLLVTTPVVFASGLTAPTTAVTGLNSNTTYYFHTWAYNGDEVMSDFDATIDTVTATAASGGLTVVINEIAWAGTVTGGYSDEWIELYNNTGSPIDLTDWELHDTAGLVMTLAGSIAANSYYLIENDEACVNDIVADLINTAVNLDNDGEYMVLKNSEGTTLDEVDCSGGWYVSLSAGESMERKDPTSAGSDSSNWAINNGITVNGVDSGDVALDATPKAQNSVYEILTPDTTDPGQVTDLAAVPGTNNGEVALTWTAPGDDGTLNNLSGGHYLIAMATYSIAAYTENVTSWWQSTPNIIIRSTGATAAVSNPETATITGLTAGTTYYFSIEAYDSSGNDSIYGANSYASGTQSKAYASTVAASPPEVFSRTVVLNEIAWKGTVGGGTSDEWMELYNNTDSDISLVDWELHDSAGAIAMTFTGSIPSHGFYLIENDEACVSDVASDLADASIDLSDAGEYMILKDNTGTTIDEVDCSAGWYVAVAQGESMERIDPTEPGTNAANWAINDGLTVTGLDSASNALVATPKKQNSVFHIFDSTAPAGVTDLSAATGTSHGEINLTWTAPGDDGTTGNNTGGYYKIRWSENFVVSGDTSTWWSGASANEKTVSVSKSVGLVESATVDSLTAGTTYCFAVKAYDSSNNESAIDDLALSSTTQAHAYAYTAPSDPVPPAAISDLTALTGSAIGTINLVWTAPGDDGVAGGTADGYLVKYSQSQITNANFDGASTYTQSWTPVAPGAFENRTVSNLSPGATYYFAVKAYDNNVPTPNYGIWPDGQYADEWNSNVPGGYQNLLSLANLGFELDSLAGWSHLSSYVSRSNSFVRTDAYSCKINDPTSTYSSRSLYSILTPVVQGSTYTVGGYFYSDYKAGSVDDTIIRLDIAWYDGTETPVSTAESPELTLSSFAEWQLKYFENYAPPGAVYARMYIHVWETSNNNNDIYIDDIVGIADTTAPAAITNLSALTGSNTGEVILTWTAPGDDGTSGDNKEGSRYELKYADYDISCGTETWWYYADELPVSIEVGPVGSAEVSSAILSPGVTYYFVIRTWDISGNVSGFDVKAVSAATQVKTYAKPGELSGHIVINELSVKDDWLELYNASGSTVNLKGWSLWECMGPEQEIITFGDWDFPPNEYLLVDFKEDSLTPVPFLENGIYKALSTCDGVSYADEVILYSSAAAVVDVMLYEDSDFYYLYNKPKIKTGDLALTYQNEHPAYNDLLSLGYWQGKYCYDNISSRHDIERNHMVLGRYLYKYTKYNVYIDKTSKSQLSNRSLARDSHSTDITSNKNEWNSCDSPTPGIQNVSPDRTRPNRITDLTVEQGDNSGTIKLTWTAPGDDGTSGTCSGYILHYGENYISADNFDNFSTVFNWKLAIMWVPKQAGEKEEYYLGGLPKSVTYYVSIVPEDENGNRSLPSNSGHAYTGTGYGSIVRINEIAAAEEGGKDWVEIYNANSEAVNLSGWKLYQKSMDLTDDEFQEEELY
ncbi:MAG: lamin tail domain-containing protein, partial [Elusimicrobia bacterium]|nr:lamin tail domain-containing protein [Elusimicrobiota bacterium]